LVAPSVIGEVITYQGIEGAASPASALKTLAFFTQNDEEQIVILAKAKAQTETCV